MATFSSRRYGSGFATFLSCFTAIFFLPLIGVATNIGLCIKVWKFFWKMSSLLWLLRITDLGNHLFGLWSWICRHFHEFTSSFVWKNESFSNTRLISWNIRLWSISISHSLWCTALVWGFSAGGNRNNMFDYAVTDNTFPLLAVQQCGRATNPAERSSIHSKLY